jgi:hypothetical protein
MARHEVEREDLMREATAYTRRCLVRTEGSQTPLFVGFRGNGGWSLYFGDDPVYQFDGDGRLRRAFVDGRPLRSQGSTLAQLTRKRGERVTELLRRDLSPAELESFRSELCGRLRSLCDKLQRGAWELLESIPDTAVIDAAPMAIDRSLRLLSGMGGAATDWLSAPLK